MITEVIIEKWSISEQAFEHYKTQERKASDYYMLHTWAHYNSVSAAKHSDYRVNVRLLNDGKKKLAFTVGTNNPEWAIN